MTSFAIVKNVKDSKARYSRWEEFQCPHSVYECTESITSISRTNDPAKTQKKKKKTNTGGKSKRIVL